MIYVLSSDRRATVHWATEQSIPLTQVKHVQNVGSLPGVLAGDGKNRIVKLDSYAQRRDHWAIDAKLKILLRRGQIKIEEPGTEASLKRALEQSAAGDVESLGSFAQYAEEPVEVTKQVDGGELSVGGALPAAPKRPVTKDPEAAVDFLVSSSQELNPADEPAPKKKRVRRTNAQIAYDKALADWESNGGSLQAVEDAKANLKPGDARLAAKPDDDLDF